MRQAASGPGNKLLLPRAVLKRPGAAVAQRSGECAPTCSMRSVAASTACSAGAAAGRLTPGETLAQLCPCDAASAPAAAAAAGADIGSACNATLCSSEGCGCACSCTHA